MGVRRLARTARALASILVAAFVFSANSLGHSGGLDKDGCHFDKGTGEHHCHPKRKRESVCDAKVPVAGDEDVVYGRVVSVTDGDTFKARIQGAVMDFRMSDIDAPEMAQPYGREARALLKAALDGKEVVMLRVETDSTYGRIVVHVWIAGLHVNREVVAQGAAWFYAEYADDDCLFEVENQARDAKRGLWALPVEERVEPWVWRKK